MSITVNFDLEGEGQSYWVDRVRVLFCFINSFKYTKESLYKTFDTLHRWRFICIITCRIVGFHFDF